MADEKTTESAGAADPVALGMALGRASASVDAELAAYLHDQRHHLHEQLKQVHLDIWEKRLGLMLRGATMVMGLVAAAILAFMVWDAAHSNGLLIEPFSVPPDLAKNGMTGEVVAAKLLDRLSQMQAQTNSARAAQSYANDWGRTGLKLDIPETGISFGELDAFLRDKLGHDTHITGEIVRNASGVSVAARAGGAGAETATGSEADMDALVQKSAEEIYRLTQPFRYGMYLASHDRVAEALTIFRAVARTGSRQDRAWAYPYWSLMSGEEEGINSELKLARQAIAEEPDNVQAHLVAGTTYDKISMPEQALREFKATSALLSNDRLGMYSAQAALRLLPSAQAALARSKGDFHDAALANLTYVRAATAAAPVVSARLAGNLAGEHDLAAARAIIADTASYQLDFQHGDTLLYVIQANMQIDSLAQKWRGVLSDADAIAPVVRRYPGMGSMLPMVTAPLIAYAQARLGRMSAAETRIAATPADCYDCLIARARIAGLAGQHARADWWFARAIDGQKSIPIAYSYWGEALLARGDTDAAVAKFAIANKLGPHYADPLEGWGEALIKKNRSDLALAKFEEAAKYAPNWGRLHLRWGEALYYAGKKEEAQQQFARSATLDLTAAERADLAGAMQG